MAETQLEKPAATEPVHSPGLGEEIASSVTHGVGAGLALAALAARATRHGDARSVAAACIYGSTLVLLYLMSTLYHSLPRGGAKRVFRILDHSAIYLLIAGTYTFYTLSVLRDAAGWAVFGVIWACAVVGIALESFRARRSRLVSSLLFAGMGWLIVCVAGRVRAAVDPGSFSLLVWGGVAYTAGALVYAAKRLPWAHPVWHLFVLAGSALHFFSIWWTF